MNTILVIGGLGFKGTNFVEHALLRFKHSRIIVLDRETRCQNDVIVEQYDVESQKAADVFRKYDVNCVVSFVKSDAVLDYCKTFSIDRYLQILSYRDDNSDVPINIRTSHCYGPHQRIDRFIPKMIVGSIKQDFLTVYGEGQDSHDWIYIDDFCNAVCKILELSENHKSYSIGGEYRIKNLDIARTILKKFELPLSFVEYINDSYKAQIECMNNESMKNLCWRPMMTFEEGLDKTILWYKKHFSATSAN
ncbi:MAG: NAD-dependent epimerase/dehydratase family protein [Nitrosarchaeum sp.]|nr:NAD-dependent epimerase/dehydratase family protein [Nitrosarchaeum sp.]